MYFISSFFFPPVDFTRDKTHPVKLNLGTEHMITHRSRGILFGTHTVLNSDPCGESSKSEVLMECWHTEAFTVIQKIDASAIIHLHFRKAEKGLELKDGGSTKI